MFCLVALAETDVERVKWREAHTALASKKSVLNPSQPSDLRDLEIRESVLVAKNTLIEDVHLFFIAAALSFAHPLSEAILTPFACLEEEATQIQPFRRSGGG
jgi:hypothetical protein